MVHDLVSFGWDKEELPEQWKGSVIVPIQQNGQELLVEVDEAYDYYQLCGKILSNIFLCRLTPYVGKIIEIISVNFDIIGREWPQCGLCMSLVRLVLGACKKIIFM